MNTRRYQLALERIRFRTAKLFGRDFDLLKSAVSVEELHPAEKIHGPPCIAIPGQYDRVRACAFGIDPKTEISQLQGAERYIEPTLRYELGNVLIHHGSIYRKGQRKFFNSEIAFESPGPVWAEYQEAALRSSYVGCWFFGHWLRDDCATHLLAEKTGMPLSMPIPPWPDTVDYLALFKQDTVTVDRAFVRRLVLFHDISQNAHKADRFRALRARLARGRSTKRSGRIVYLMRGAGGHQRALSNENEIVLALARQGVVILQAEMLSAKELVDELFGARIVISVEGSQLSHALYTLRDDGGILVIQPPDRFFNSHMDWARALSFRYGIVVGEQIEGGFHLPTDDLLRSIEAMDANIP
jgi:hypothetical protein